MAQGRWQLRKCVGCRTPFPAWDRRSHGHCAACKALRRRIAEVHHADVRGVPADDPGRAARVAGYAAAVAAGRRLFEPTPRPAAIGGA